MVLAQQVFIIIIIMGSSIGEPICRDDLNNYTPHRRYLWNWKQKAKPELYIDYEECEIIMIYGKLVRHLHDSIFNTKHLVTVLTQRRLVTLLNYYLTHIPDDISINGMVLFVRKL